jgi:triacylglycerol lipase
MLIPRPSTFDLEFAIDVICTAANSAYQIMNLPSPVLPAGYALVGPLQADPQAALPAMLLADPKQHRIVNHMLLESNIFGLVAWNQAAQSALVAFRGTETIMEWIDDVDAFPAPDLSVPGAGLVHVGFQLVYEHVRHSVARLLTNACQGAKRIVVTGYSLGGAVAVLSGLDIAANVTLGIVPELYTLAGPRTGAPDFAASFNRLIPVCNRIVNFMDVVPQLPLPPLYEHVGQEILVHGGFQALDVVYAHRLTTYLAGLQKLRSTPGS